MYSSGRHLPVYPHPHLNCYRRPPTSQEENKRYRLERESIIYSYRGRNFSPHHPPNVSWVCLIISWVNIRKLNISDTIYCDRVEYRFLLRRCTSKSCYLGCHGNSIRRYFKFYLKTNISHGICVWWEQMVWSLQMQQFPPLKKRWIGGPPLRRYEEQMEDDNIFSSIEKIPPPLSEEKKGADVQLGADTSAYMYPGSGPYHPSVLLYTHHISFLYFFLSSRLWLYRKM